MIKVTIYERYIENVGDVRGYLRKFANSSNVIIKENVFFKVEDMVEMSADVCLLDYKAFLEDGDILLKWKDENNIKFIFITSDIKDIIDIMQNHPEQYLILSPVEEESLVKVFENLKLRIKRIAIIAKLAHQEDKRIYVKDLNYINITKRNLRYHLADGREYDSQTLRQSFSKEISPLLIKPELYFIQPSLLVNMTNIETLWDDHMQFENGDIVYYPKTAYEKLKAAWKEYLI
jgi:hypothetical protein